MTAFLLVGPGGSPRFDVPHGRLLVLGRGAGSDVPVFDSTISRRHAELVAEDGGIRVRDLESSNGTFVNGQRVDGALVAPGDVVTFGRLAFEVATPPPVPVSSKGSEGEPARDHATIVARRVPGRQEALENALDRTRASANTTVREHRPESDQRRLALLLEVSKKLGRLQDTDALLREIVATVFQILDVDRVALLLRDSGNELVAKVSRDRAGRDVSEAIPRSIARRALDEKVALLSDDAPADTRFGGQSIVVQQVRSAICAPLLGGDGEVVGLLYVDNLTLTHRYVESDLDFMIAFAGIAAVALENSRLAEQIRRDAMVRSNFERYFAPQLAERIAAAPEQVRLGGERREIAVLFTDIRGFTPLAESMEPDVMAALLTEYFTEMVDCVFQSGGTLDKFMGDAVMAQWGAPIAAGDDADRALQAALHMQRAMRSLNDTWRAQGRPELGIGIGINFGTAFAGNIGSDQRLEYTVIGDTVNTAYRVCEAANAGEILVSGELRKRLQQPVSLEARPPLKVKGKRAPVAVYRATQ